MGNPPSSIPPAPAPNPTPGPRAGTHIFQAPTGTRDFYPADLNRLRYIQEAWRRTSINHGFEEIDGPAFEHLDLYTVKSGEGIVSELFSFERFGGEKTFALRPEFTPTLARMYVAKAASLPKPTKWFWQQNCYRAERPQRGRLREFCQWNCDIIGAESNEPDAQARVDAEVIACCVGMLEEVGLTPKDVRIRISHRAVVEKSLLASGVPYDSTSSGLMLIDSKSKLTPDEFESRAVALGLDVSKFEGLLASAEKAMSAGKPGIEFSKTVNLVSSEESQVTAVLSTDVDFGPLRSLFEFLASAGIRKWCDLDFGIARGLAYYTGMVFEVHEASGAERAIAGGGRYDKLIEMFGGPPTPAVGFGMGDVVLSLVLQDKGLMPPEEKIAESLGLRPDALVISNGTPEADAAVAGVVASLRRAGLHARRSYKATRNIGKLLQDAAKTRARFCVILESVTQAAVKDMGTQEQMSCGIAEIAARIARSPQV